jgi:hypothetical protein
VEVRPEDFRQEWPYALARAMREGTALMTMVDQQRLSVERLATFSVEALKSAEDRVERHQEVMQGELRKAGSELTGQIDAALEVLRRESAELAANRKAFEELRATVLKEKRELALANHALARERAEFNQMSWWDRLLARA